MNLDSGFWRPASWPGWTISACFYLDLLVLQELPGHLDLVLEVLILGEGGVAAILIKLLGLLGEILGPNFRGDPGSTTLFHLENGEHLIISLGEGDNLPSGAIGADVEDRVTLLVLGPDGRGPGLGCVGDLDSDELGVAVLGDDEFSMHFGPPVTYILGLTDTYIAARPPHKVVQEAGQRLAWDVVQLCIFCIFCILMASKAVFTSF